MCSNPPLGYEGCIVLIAYLYMDCGTLFLGCVEILQASDSLSFSQGTGTHVMIYSIKFIQSCLQATHRSKYKNLCYPCLSQHPPQVCSSKSTASLPSWMHSLCMKARLLFPLFHYVFLLEMHLGCLIYTP